MIRFDVTSSLRFPERVIILISNTHAHYCEIRKCIGISVGGHIPCQSAYVFSVNQGICYLVMGYHNVIAVIHHTGICLHAHIMKQNMGN